MTLTEFLLARIEEDEAAARACAEMFPPPWEVSDRGWRVRIYASDVPIPDLMSDNDDAMTTRNPVVMEVEPDRHIEDPRWLSERVEHVRRHDPARVLAECAAKRRIVELHKATMVKQWMNPVDGPACREEEWSCDICGWFETGAGCDTLRALASVYADHPDYREEWKP